MRIHQETFHYLGKSFWFGGGRSMLGAGELRYLLELRAYLLHGTECARKHVSRWRESTL